MIETEAIPTDGRRSLLDVLDAAERQLLVEFLLATQRDYGAEVPSALLAECESLAMWGLGFGLAPEARWLAWATAMAVDPVTVEAIAANVLAFVAEGRRPPSWTAGRSTMRTPEDVARDLRAHHRCSRVEAGDWRDDAPVVTREDAAAQAEANRLRRVEDARRRASRRRAEEPDSADRERRYALAALASACSEVLSSVVGGRHRELNRAAWRIGGLVGGGMLPEDEAREALLAAAEGVGLPSRDADRIVRRALADGAAKAPRGRPDRA